MMGNAEQRKLESERVLTGLAGLSVSSLPDCGWRIDAPPELALPLAGVLEALARSLGAAQAGSRTVDEAAQ